MKAGLLKKIVGDYAGFFPSDWKRVKNELMRRAGDWVQIVGINPSRFDDTYVPRTCLEFLKKPGEATGTFLVQELKHPAKDVQRWISMREHERSARAIFDEMCAQFRPDIRSPLDLATIKTLLSERLSYWPHAYALCVMVAEEGDRAEARRYYDIFLKATADKPKEWFDHRRAELERCLELMASREELRSHLASIATQKLASLGAQLQQPGPSARRT